MSSRRCKNNKLNLNKMKRRKFYNKSRNWEKEKNNSKRGIKFPSEPSED